MASLQSGQRIPVPLAILRQTTRTYVFVVIHESHVVCMVVIWITGCIHDKSGVDILKLLLEKEHVSS